MKHGYATPDPASSSKALRVNDLKNALQLVPVGSLSTYERPNKRRVAEIARSLDRTMELGSPIVADIDQGLLIDGHHRAAAFRWLGLTTIPCFTVAYLGDGVRIGGWRRVTNAPSSEVASTLAVLARDSGGPYSVVVEDPCEHEITRASFPDCFAAAWHLERISLWLVSAGYEVGIEPDTDVVLPEQLDQTRLAMDPVVGKQDVLEAVRRGSLFPEQVNRHLVDGRPVAMDIPLMALTSDNTFEDFLLDALRHGAPAAVKGGSVHDTRWYEETTTMFTRR